MNNNYMIRLNNLLTNTINRGGTKDELIVIVSVMLRSLNGDDEVECENRIITKLENKYNPK